MAFINTLYNLWPQGDKKIPGLRDAIAAAAPIVFPKYGIEPSLVVAHYMAQMSLECNGGLEVVENLSYTPRRMCQVWPSRFRSIESAQPYAGNPRALANKVYNGRMGNRGGTDDGYNYRGRGATQTTGHYGYDLLSRAYGLPNAELAHLMADRHLVDQGKLTLQAWQARYPIQMDFVSNPDAVNDPANFLECGVVDFILCGCLPYAQKNDIVGVTEKLNGGRTGLADRIAWFRRWQPALR